MSLKLKERFGFCLCASPASQPPAVGSTEVTPSITPEVDVTQVTQQEDSKGDHPVFPDQVVEIGKMLEKCLLDLEIEDLFGVTLDNVSANSVAIEYLQTSVMNWTRATVRSQYMQWSQLMNLVTYDISLFHYFILIRLYKFKECAALEKIDCKKMVFLYVTRWNSIYLMLEDAIPYERVFKSEDYFLSSSCESECEVDVTKKKNTKKKNKPRHHAPYAADWSYAMCLVKCLKIFFDATVKFSASTQVTTHEILWQLALIHEQLVRLRVIGDQDSHIYRMVELMFRTYNTYYGDYEDMNFVLFFAKLLDPREKESGLKFDLEGVDDMVVCVQEENIEDMLESRKKRRRMNVYCTHPKSELESTGKRILIPWRSSLSSSTFVTLLCTQSWLQKPIGLDFICDYVPDDNASI
ncbi:zinc finger BED domain-containing protein RICESLEEPER 3-like [Papaver somniferum]|uniref:zinc finger BED domain-containing protein RICESLEEPER 3-like n=1 Tax=Papaver somniferum TaxID=3469 RepID=UPI000E700AE8|nr:zinc finger BED domain-containing protein RICESLEEPER 3-like [Papaver somniferum]